jgi:hypothetical protein
MQWVRGLKQTEQKAEHSNPSTESNFTVKFVKYLTMSAAQLHYHLTMSAAPLHYHLTIQQVVIK